MTDVKSLGLISLRAASTLWIPSLYCLFERAVGGGGYGGNDNKVARLSSIVGCSLAETFLNEANVSKSDRRLSTPIELELGRRKAEIIENIELCTYV